MSKHQAAPILAPVLTLTLLASGAALAQAEPIAIAPGALRAVGSVDERYQSYNVEMIEVMGGKWWAPYPDTPDTRDAPETPNTPNAPNAPNAADTPRQPTAPRAGAGANASAADAPATSNGIDSAGFLYRPPEDLANPRLRKLAAALSPAYVRLSDTWTNTMYFDDADADAAPPAPPGFGAVLTAHEWQGVIDFSNAIDAPIVTSFSIGAGVRDAAGSWTPAQAAKFLAFTRHAGGRIAAVEFFNEPNLAAIGGAPKGYDAAAYGRDFQLFRAFITKAAPEIEILGPGPVGEGRLLAKMPAGLKSADLLVASGPGLDAVSYHFYGAVSQRCTAMGAAFQTTSGAALDSGWLSATNADAAFYGALRDRYEPGKPLWLTETAESACGGNPWAADFIDSFRYLNQLGSLATRGVKVVMHNTLTAGDYALIDGATMRPRPNYWAALLWRRLMGTTVLDAGSGAAPNLYLYAHCQRHVPGGVVLLALNADRGAVRQLALPTPASRYTLSADNLLAADVQLNGSTLALDAHGQLPAIEGAATPAGVLSLAPASISFIALPQAGNPHCR